MFTPLQLDYQHVVGWRGFRNESWAPCNVVWKFKITILETWQLTVQEQWDLQHLCFRTNFTHLNMWIVSPSKIVHPASCPIESAMRPGKILKRWQTSERSERRHPESHQCKRKKLDPFPVLSRVPWWLSWWLWWPQIQARNPWGNVLGPLSAKPTPHSIHWLIM